MQISKIAAGVLASLSLIAFGLNSAFAESADDFYKKNKVTMIIGTGPGGASDVGARLFAKYWPEVTGGEMQVKNIPGAGGVVALNYLANNTKADGLSLHIMMHNCAYQMPYLQKNKAAKYDPTKFSYLIGGFCEPWILTPNPKYKTLDDLKNAEELKFGAVSPYSECSFAALPVFQTLGLKAKVVKGYKSQTEIVLAVGKGELDFTLSPLSQGMRAVNQGTVGAPLLVVTPERCPAIPDVPCLAELVKMTPEQQKIFESSQSLSAIIRTAAFPEGVPADRIRYFRDAIARLVELPAFKEDAKKILLLGATPVLGKELDDFIEASFKIRYDDLAKGLEPYVKN